MIPSILEMNINPERSCGQTQREPELSYRPRGGNFHQKGRQAGSFLAAALVKGPFCQQGSHPVSAACASRCHSCTLCPSAHSQEQGDFTAIASCCLHQPPLTKAVLCAGGEGNKARGHGILGVTFPEDMNACTSWDTRDPRFLTELCSHAEPENYTALGKVTLRGVPRQTRCPRAARGA